MDRRTYEITIEDGGRRHTVAISEPVIPRAMHRLIIRLRELATPKGGI
jgi:emfourin